MEYVCRGYHRNGKAYCSSHRIHEEVLDAAMQAYAQTVREQCAEEVEKLAQLQKMWALRKPTLDAHILSLQGNIRRSEEETDMLVMEKLSNCAVCNNTSSTQKATFWPVKQPKCSFQVGTGSGTRTHTPRGTGT